MQLYVTLKLTLPTDGHWGCVRIVYIGSAADGVNIVLTILMIQRESYRVVSVIRVNGVREMWLVWLCESV